MCDTISSTAALLFPHSAIRPPNPSFTPPVFIPTTLQTRGSQFTGSCFASNEAETTKPLNKSKIPLRTNRNSIPTGSTEHDFYGELGFKEKEKEQIENFEKIGIGNGTRVSQGVDFIEFEEDSEGKRVKGENLVGTEEGFDEVGLKLEEMDIGTVAAVRKGRELMKRSNLIAKQVISIQSALSLGFVSQIWVDTISWVVLVVEVRPNLLSGELERFFLEDVRQVGDVVLIQDESVMENELRMVGLETLVGYNVVTPGRQSIGKVRGYTFNINSGTVESLELDSLGISIIPSSLVSTYALLVEDVLEVVSDTVVVHEAAASRIHRLSKGLWDSQKLRNSIDQLGEHSDLERRSFQLDDDRDRRRSVTGRKIRPKRREVVDDWELPMDYL